MSGYNQQEKTFTLTAVKMEHYHRNHTHATFPRKVCPICNAQYGQEYLETVAAFFRANGFDVVDVGDAHITISAPSKPRKKFGMWITKETDALYQLLAGRIEPQPGSIPSEISFLDPCAQDVCRDNTGTPLQEEDPMTQLKLWLNDLKERRLLALRQAELQVKHLSATPENSSENGDQENVKHVRQTIIARQAEIALIEKIQSKIRG